MICDIICETGVPWSAFYDRNWYLAHQYNALHMLCIYYVVDFVKNKMTCSMCFMNYEQKNFHRVLKFED